MLIINDIDIVQADANKITYYSKDVEKKQSSNNSTILQSINTFPTTATKKSIVPGRSSLVNIGSNTINNEPSRNRIENETLISISNINQYSSK